MDGMKAFSVSEFNDLINQHLVRFGEVVVEGEISELKISQNKWVFITIKDEQASVEVFGTVFRIKNLKQLEEGMNVYVVGIPGLYQKTGRFSINSDQIIPAGEGALRLAFEKLKAQLEKEGLFEISRKRPLPDFPLNIGLITAKGSQAFNDFTKILAERMGGIRIYFYPVQVQGRDSVGSILSAFKYFNQNEKQLNLDLIVLTRGGGSLEDLISFNDEQVARAIFSSKVPVVCGVGHEGDVSLADLVADVRASTPSNAAELIVRHRVEVLAQVNQNLRLIHQHLETQIEHQQVMIENFISRISQLFGQQIQQFDDVIRRFNHAFKLYREQVAQAHVRLDALLRLLKTLDYREVLKRGFSITYGPDGKILTEVAGIKENINISTQLKHGRVGSRVTSINNE